MADGRALVNIREVDMVPQRSLRVVSGDEGDDDIEEMPVPQRRLGRGAARSFMISGAGQSVPVVRVFMLASCTDDAEILGAVPRIFASVRHIC